MNSRPSKPSNVTCKSCDQQVLWYWRSARHCWRNNGYCCTCYNTKLRHGMTRLEYDNYLARGCWVCGNIAVVIDHDHDTCPQASHSCDDCRRGPACHRCNATLKTGYTVEAMQERIAWYQDQLDNLARVSDALANFSKEEMTNA